MPLIARAPRPPLSAFVKTLWLADGYVAGPHRLERILPSGECSLIVDLRPSGTSAIGGPYSQSFVMSTAAELSVAGVQFKPGGAHPFLNLPVDELVNQHVPLDVLWGTAAVELRERMLEAPTPDLKLLVLERSLAQRLTRAPSGHPAVVYALNAFDREPAVVRIGDVTCQLGISHQRFLDIFKSEVGLTAKLFCRIRRFQRVLGRVHQQKQIDWADVALLCGYYDQAHFNKEFLAFSGVNPSTYRSSAPLHRNHLPIAD